MLDKFNCQMKLGEIVNQLPEASNIFKQYQIDFCCGGNRPLKEAAEAQGINLEQVLQQLNEAYQRLQEMENKQVDWQTIGYSFLIDHILQTHHSYLKTELPEISALVTKILRVHGSGHQELAQLHRQFHLLQMDLMQHLIKEEEELFPLIKQYENEDSKDLLEMIKNKIEELEKEHVDAGKILKTMRELTDHYFIPDDACKTFRLTYQSLEYLETDLFKHIHLENNILFPRLLSE